MALNLFKRVDSVKGLFAVESISLIYNALTTIMVLILFPRMDHPVIMLSERAGIVAITFALIYLYRKYPCKLTAFIRMAVQMAFLAYWYPDTFEFNRLFPNLDNFFASAEQFLFRCQPSVEFSEHFPSMWFSEPFNMGYFAYYPMIGIVTIYYFLFRFEWFEKVSFVLVTSFFIYYLIYILVPVAGPQFYFPAIGMDNVMAQHFPAIGDYFNNNDISYDSNVDVKNTYRTQLINSILQYGITIISMIVVHLLIMAIVVRNRMDRRYDKIKLLHGLGMRRGKIVRICMAEALRESLWCVITMPLILLMELLMYAEFVRKL